MEENEILVFSSTRVGHEVRADGVGKLKVDDLQQATVNFYNKLCKIFGTLQEDVGAFELEEVTIQAEISVDGQIGFLGTGTKAGAKGSVTFKLKKKAK